MCTTGSKMLSQLGIGGLNVGSNVNKNQMSEMAHIVAKRFGINCTTDDCVKCVRYGGLCSCSEMVEILLASGYNNQKIELVDDNVICEMAKTISVARGFGCHASEQCKKCSCNLMAGCVPYEVAKTLCEEYYGNGVAQ